MIRKLIRKLFPKRPGHIGYEEHPVGSMPGCPACDKWNERRENR